MLNSKNKCSFVVRSTSQHEATGLLELMTILLTGSFDSASLATFSQLLHENSVSFSVCSDAPFANEELNTYVVSEDDLHKTPWDVVVDFGCDDELHPFSVAAAQSFPSESLLLVAHAFSTATDVRSEGVFRNVINFNGIPGFVGNTSVVELAPALDTPEDCVTTATSLFASIQLECEVVGDRVGLVSPRILSLIINEAAFSVMEKVASPEDIDRAMQLGTNYPKGPLAWADEIGLDIVVMLLESLYEEYGQERYRPCVYLKQLVRAGYLGKKSQRGFYSYS